MAMVRLAVLPIFFVCHALATMGLPHEDVSCEGDLEASADLRDEVDMLEVTLLQTAMGINRVESSVLSHRSVQQAHAQEALGENGETFVHLFEWSWDDIAQECEQWLGPKGFKAVQISPPNEHNQGDSWTARYQPVSYSKLTSRSGNESQLSSMIARCKSAGVGIYADVVINQMAPRKGVGVAGTEFGDRTYAPDFGPDDFHHLPDDKTRNCGVHDYKNKTNIQSCDLLGMPDLCTGCEHVQAAIVSYVEKLQQLGIEGFRVDAAKHMNAKDLSGMFSKIDSDLFRFLEVLKAPDEAVQPSDYFGLGRITEIGYGHTVGSKFKAEGKLWNDLQTLGKPWGLLSTDEAIVFLDNHDTQRHEAVLTYKDGALYTMANVFMLAFPYGYPKIMSSYDFSSPDQGPPSKSVHKRDGSVRCGKKQPWVCEHRQPAIANMVAWRRSAGSLPVKNFQGLDGEDYGKAVSFCRGEAACVAFNRQESATWPVTMTVSMPAGEYCNVAVSDSEDCPTVRVDEDGTAALKVPRLGVVAFHVGAKPKSD